MSNQNRFSKLTVAERISTAKAKTERVVDHLLYVLELHENNEIIVYSPTLREQIPTSYAANAFIVFRHGLHQFEIVRLCALWDSSEPEKENITTIIDLIDDSAVIDTLARETAEYWKSQSAVIFNASNDPELDALEIDVMRKSNDQFGDEQAEKARAELRQAIDLARSILASPKLVSIMNLRNKYLAHSLSETRHERRVGTIDPMKYGDERDLLNKSLLIATALFCWVNGKSFDFENSRKIDRENAEALWGACTFDIKH